MSVLKLEVAWVAGAWKLWAQEKRAREKETRAPSPPRVSLARARSTQAKLEVWYLWNQKTDVSRVLSVLKRCS